MRQMIVVVVGEHSGILVGDKLDDDLLTTIERGETDDTNGEESSSLWQRLWGKNKDEKGQRSEPDQTKGETERHIGVCEAHYVGLLNPEAKARLARLKSTKGNVLPELLRAGWTVRQIVPVGPLTIASNSAEFLGMVSGATLSLPAAYVLVERGD